MFFYERMLSYFEVPVPVTQEIRDLKAGQGPERFHRMDQIAADACREAGGPETPYMTYLRFSGFGFSGREFTKVTAVATTLKP